MAISACVIGTAREWCDHPRGNTQPAAYCVCGKADSAFLGMRHG